jgi:deoxyribodipyrimidine photo-lyase
MSFPPSFCGDPAIDQPASQGGASHAVRNRHWARRGCAPSANLVRYFPWRDNNERLHGPVLRTLSPLRRHAHPALYECDLHQTDIHQTSSLSFSPSRAAGLAAWRSFAPRAGATYAGARNHDYGPAAQSTASRLSPFIRHRVLTEPELAAAAHREHGEAAQKFIEEIAWRTYWKGWLQAHPTAWRRYRAQLAALSEVTTPGLAAACVGATGIDCFDSWVHELKTQHYLHNHARMWFASIWIHTLHLPWQLGAEFFESLLLDGDPASNLLSWRWVAGLQTVGKPYLARADNIARYTDGRFHPKGLAESPRALTEEITPLEQVPVFAGPPPGPARLLLHDDDLDGDGFYRAVSPQPVLVAATDISGNQTINNFRAGLRADAAARTGATTLSALTAPALIGEAARCGVNIILTPHAPIGPTADALTALEPALAAANLTLHRLTRPWDAAAWPHATKGFFAFRGIIPTLLG